MYSRDILKKLGHEMTLRQVDVERNAMQSARAEGDYEESYAAAVRVQCLVELLCERAASRIATLPEGAWWQECLRDDLHQAQEDVFETELSLAKFRENDTRVDEIRQAWWEHYAKGLAGGPYGELEAQYLAAYLECQKAVVEDRDDPVLFERLETLEDRVGTQAAHALDRRYRAAVQAKAERERRARALGRRERILERVQSEAVAGTGRGR